jgi:glutaminase
VLPPEISRRVDERLGELYRRQIAAGDAGVVSYYESGHGYLAPDGATAARDRLAVALCTLDGELHQTGDTAHRFALQSLSKVFAYALALEDRGRDAVMERVGVEPSGDAFSSITFDERHQRPHNPMVNAGALATTALVRGADPDEQLARILDLVRRLAANDELAVDEHVFERELATADRNRATAYLMRSRGMLAGDVEEILALYLRQCAISVTAGDLAMIAAVLADGAQNPITGEQVVARTVSRDVLTVMYTCGMYDFAGEWAFQIGLPAKSGVSGGILAVVPHKLGIGVFSPGLDPYGNSVRGVRVCQEVSERLGLHVFADEREDVVLR